MELMTLLELLRSASIETLVDVRSQPYSSFVPQFNRAPLERELAAAQMRYAFGGGELGGRPSEPTCYDIEGHVLYGRLARSQRFLEGVGRLERVAASSNTAIMCSEEDPTGCHRHLLVARVLATRGWDVVHLRSDHSLQPYGSMADVRARKHQQTTLFGRDDEDVSWRSLRSVSRSGVPPTSSEH